jgi:hypothetical protein
MFQYNPTVNNISGQIYGQGLERAAGYDAQGIQAQAEADLMRAQRQHQLILDGAQFVGDSAKKVAAFLVGGPAGAAMASAGGGGGGGGGGGLLDTIIGAYAQKEQDKSDSKIYGNLMKVVAPAFGEDGDAIMEQWKSLESDRDKARFGSTLFSSLGQISNMYMANRNAGIRENQQSLTAAMPRVREAAAAQGRVAAGQGTMGVPANVNLDYVR